MPREHLLAVWNPLYSHNAMETHLRVLHDAVREFRAGSCREDEVYVWWGKIRSTRRDEALPHHDQILNMRTEPDRNDPEPETHVYLTDYSSLYVGHLGEISPVRPSVRVPAYYADQALECEFWFKIWDIRRIIDNDLPMVIDALQNLRNVRYGSHPVSIYGGMRDLPLIVKEFEPQRYFDDKARTLHAEGRFWIEYDSEQAGVGATERKLREHMFGDDAWRAFSPIARHFIATGEKLFRDHYRDMSFDFSPVLIEYCKALEVQTNALLLRGLRQAPRALRTFQLGPKEIVLGDNPHLMLSELARYLDGSSGRQRFIATQFVNGGWFTEKYPRVLKKLARFRGPAAHSRSVTRSDAIAWRNRLCGIGFKGTFLDLSSVRPVSERSRATVDAGASTAMAFANED